MKVFDVFYKHCALHFSYLSLFKFLKLFCPYICNVFAVFKKQLANHSYFILFCITCRINIKFKDLRNKAENIGFKMFIKKITFITLFYKHSMFVFKKIL